MGGEKGADKYDRYPKIEGTGMVAVKGDDKGDELKYAGRVKSERTGMIEY